VIKLSDRTKYILYVGHAFIAWSGLFGQLLWVFHNQSILIVWWWPAAMLAAELMALPLAWSSKYGIWKWCHIGGAVLCAILLVGVLIFK